jgi:hypothetical protein
MLETIKENIIESNNFETYYLSEWQFLPHKELLITPFIMGKVSDNNPFNFLNDEFSDVIKASNKNLTDGHVLSLRKIAEYYSNLFITDKSYRISSAVAHQYLYCSDIKKRTEVVLYPSVQRQLNSVNLAINPNTVLEKMRLKKVYKIEINSFDTNSKDLDSRLIEVAENNNGKLIWRTRNEEDKNDFDKQFETT